MGRYFPLFREGWGVYFFARKSLISGATVARITRIRDGYVVRDRRRGHRSTRDDFFGSRESPIASVRRATKSRSVSQRDATSARATRTPSGAIFERRDPRDGYSRSATPIDPLSRVIVLSTDNKYEETLRIRPGNNVFQTLSRSRGPRVSARLGAPRNFFPLDATVGAPTLRGRLQSAANFIFDGSCDFSSRRCERLVT